MCVLLIFHHEKITTFFDQNPRPFADAKDWSDRSPLCNPQPIHAALDTILLEAH